MIRKILGAGASAAFALAAVMLLLANAGTTVSANVNSVSAAPSTVDTEQNSVITIDADEGDGDVRILATTGDFIACTDGAGVPCLLSSGGPLAAGSPSDRDITVDDGGGAVPPAPPVATNTDTLLVTWEAPSTGGTANITAIQDNVARSASITVRGAAAAVEINVFRPTVPALTSGSACQGDAIVVLNAVGANAGNGGSNSGQLCTLVRDAAGNRLPNQAVIYSTTDGTVSPLTDTTSATGGSAVASTITAGSTGQAGDEATITASAGGQSATVEVKFGGNPASCTLTTDPTSVAVGGSATVNVEVLDSTGGPVPDGTTVGVAQANPGAGVNAQILGSPTTTSEGEAQVSAIAAIQGAIALGATAPNGGGSNPITCTGTLIATGSVIPPTGPGTGTGGFTGTAPGAGSIGLLVTSGEATAASLITALGAAGCNVQTLAVLQGGAWDIYINGAPAVVNAGFPTALADTTPFFVRCN